METNLSSTVSNLAGYPVEWFVSPPGRALCGTCHKVLNEPRYCKAGHLFCVGCIKLSADEDTLSCPICDVTLVDKELVVCFFAAEAISELIVHCCCHSKEKQCCSWTGMFKERANRVCEYQYQECTMDGCSEQVQRRMMRLHIENECEKRLVACQFCDQQTVCSELSVHHASCKERPVKCGCSVVIPLSQFATHKASDCSLVFADCPLSRVGMCREDCTGKVRISDMQVHGILDPDLTTRLCDKIYEQRECLLLAETHKQPRTVSPEHEAGEVGYDSVPFKRQNTGSDYKTDIRFNNASEDALVPCCAEIFVQHISGQVNQTAVSNLFKECGTIKRCFMKDDHKFNSGEQHAFIDMSTPEEALFAVQKTNGVRLDGSVLKVSMNIKYKCFYQNRPSGNINCIHSVKK